jgi:hypothetical protein
LLAVRIPVTNPRLLANQRVATVAASGTDTAPVALPTTTPHRRSSCQGAFMTVVSEAPVAIVASATSITRRTPKRSMSAAENGAVRPNRRSPSETASEIVPRDQPYSFWRGTIRTPGVARKPAVVIRVTNVTATISHA